MWVDAALGALLAAAWMAGRGRHTALMGLFGGIMACRLLPDPYGLPVAAVLMIAGSAASRTRGDPT